MGEAIVAIVNWAREQGVAWWHFVWLAVGGVVLVIIMRVGKFFGTAAGTVWDSYGKVLADVQHQLTEARKERDEALKKCDEMQRRLDLMTAMADVQRMRDSAPRHMRQDDGN